MGELILAALVFAAASDGVLWYHAAHAFDVEPDAVAPAWQGHCAIAVVAVVAGLLVERSGARSVSLIAFAVLAIASSLLGLAPSSQLYRLARHLQLAAAVAALVGLTCGTLRAIEPRRWGLILAAASISGYVGSKLVGVYAQAILAEQLGWRVYPLAFAAVVAGGGVLAARWPVSADPLPRRVASVFDAEAPTPVPASGTRRAFKARPVFGFAVGLVCAALLSNLWTLVLPPTPPPTGWVAEGLVGTSQILVLFGVAFVARRVAPGRIGAACSLLLCLGCAALTGAMILRVAMPPTLAGPEARIVVRIISNAAEFAFALAILQAGADDLGRSAGLVVAAIPVVWSLWGLLVMLVYHAALPPIAIDAIACAVAGVPVLVGFFDRGRGVDGR